MAARKIRSCSLQLFTIFSDEIIEKSYSDLLADLVF